MKKSELKTGMGVELRNGEHRLVFIGVEHDFREEPFLDFLLDPTTRRWEPIANYNDYLTHKSYNDWDVIKVFSLSHPYGLGSGFNTDKYKGKLLWERTEKTYEIDGVEYSEQTLKNLIKKATQ